jgi:hypothetical protein
LKKELSTSRSELDPADYNDDDEDDDDYAGDYDHLDEEVAAGGGYGGLGGSAGIASAFSLIDPTADAFASLSPPLLLLAIGRCQWFERVSVTNCPGLIGRLAHLRGLSELTHLEVRSV